MRMHSKQLLIAGSLVCSAFSGAAQVYSPKVLAADQLDTSDLKTLAQGILRNAHAVTDREKAEAIWRFMLTDGRFVKPGMFYHIAGWSYEEPLGEVLDPIKLLNSYGFGLCYQDGPLLQALWDAAGFAHTRVWFLTGHAVSEVFYDGRYHYYDSDMMGYTTLGGGPPRTSTVASVQELESDPKLLLSKLSAPNAVKGGAVDNPWYNADVRASAIGDLADLFSADRNYVYSATRYPQGHTMDFVLRPGERMTRFYNQPDSSVRYLPYKSDGAIRAEFWRDIGESLPLRNGPKSEKDSRRWSTGLIEYAPTDGALHQAQAASAKAKQMEFAMPSPYVLIGAKFSMNVALSATESLSVETSIDAGHTWTTASTLVGPHLGEWVASPATLLHSANGELNAVAGSYGYLVRFTLHNAAGALAGAVGDLDLSSLFEFNPRTLPALTVGSNLLSYQASDLVRTELPVHAADAQSFAASSKNVTFVSEDGQGYLENKAEGPAELIFKLAADSGSSLNGIDAGGRFLDLRDGIAPNKLNAEIRRVAPWPAGSNPHSSALIAWSRSPDGPWTTLWTYEPGVTWPDGHVVPKVLRWPEVDRSVRDLKNSPAVYVRYQFTNLAVDAIRLATLAKPATAASKLIVTHTWLQDGKPAKFETTLAGAQASRYQFSIPGSSAIQPQALTFAAE